VTLAVKNFSLFSGPHGEFFSIAEIKNEMETIVEEHFCEISNLAA